MSERLTNKWTNTLEEAFGDTPAVKKGRIGEMFVIKTLKSWGWSVKDHQKSKDKQIIGADISFKSPKWLNYYTGSIKHNMLADGSFRVYEEWINKTITDRVFHCNESTGWLCWYETQKMQMFYKKNIFYTKVDARGKRYLNVGRNDYTPFQITRTNTYF